MNAEDVIALLGLQPHPSEGGWFVETYRSDAVVPHPAATGTRNLSTAIYYLLTGRAISAMHRLPGDEVFHHYGGDAVEMLLLHADGTSEVRVLGSDLAAGERPQIIVPGGVWQGSVLRAGEGWALIGTTMAPGYAQEDYVHGDEALLKSWPDHADAIQARLLTEAAPG